MSAKPTDAEMAEAQADLMAYQRAMMQPNGWRACLTIEEAWELDGYPPAVVTEVLWEIGSGIAQRDDALARALS
jgi:hypothetical protein